MIAALVPLLIIGGVGYSIYHHAVAPRLRYVQATLPEDLDGACDHPAQYFPEAADYQGSGPHPFVVSVERASSWTSVSIAAAKNETVPTGWLTADPRAVQLVVCLGEAEAGPALGTCNYSKSLAGTDGAPAPLYQGIYHAKIVRPRTAETIAKVTISGSPDPKACPNTLLRFSSESRNAYTYPGLAQYRAALSGYVDGPARS